MFCLITKKEISKTIKLGRLETSEDFKASKPKPVKTTRIENLKAEVRSLTKQDIEYRKLYTVLDDPERVLEALR